MFSVPDFCLAIEIDCIYIIKVRVRAFSIGGHNVGPTELKFGMEDHIYPEEVIAYISYRHTYTQGQDALKTGFRGPYSPV